MKIEPQIRFAAKYIPEPNSGCWIWLAHVDRGGYARMRIGNRMYSAHRFSYEIVHGEVPEGFELDHICNMRCCVNPDHLRPLTHLENVRRGSSPSSFHRLQTHCVNGHEFTEENTYVWRGKMRQCRTCGRAKTAAYHKRKNKAFEQEWFE